MQISVSVNTTDAEFEVRNGLRQWCTIAPIHCLTCTYFDAVIKT